MKRTALISIGVIGIVLLAWGGFYYFTKKVPPPSPIACTKDAKQCPNGTYVSRTGEHCEFAECPPDTAPPEIPIPPTPVPQPTPAPAPTSIPKPLPKPLPKPVPTPTPAPTTVPVPQPIPASSTSECTSDKDCPSPNYVCEATQGYGTAYPNNSQPSTFTITSGTCKLKAGNVCSSDTNCQSGLVCHANVCTEPRDGQCSGPDDTSCPTGYRCIQGCGPPVARIGDPPPPYYCEVEELAAKPQNCPICLASNTMIATPSGNRNVQEIKVGMTILSLNKKGVAAPSNVIKVSRTLAPKTHQVIHLTLSDTREVWVSPNHPTADGRSIQELRKGDAYDKARVQSTELVPYWGTATYDILPDTDTGTYWANGVLLGSTLKK